MSSSVAVRVVTETVGAEVRIVSVTPLGAVPIGPQGPTGDTGPAGADGAAGPQGDPGEGVPIGGTAGQVLTKDSGTDFDTSWQDAAGGGGGVTDADFLVGTAHAGLSAEIVVGTAPGGELGGTWASPTVDATHSGSSHAGVQAAAEATAAADATSKVAAEATARDAAIETHRADTTVVHGIADTSALLDTGDIGASVQAHSAVLDATTASFLTADETKLDGIAAGATVDQEVFVEDPNTPGSYVVGPVYIGETDPAVGGEDPYAWLDPASLGAPADYLSTSAAEATYASLASLPYQITMSALHPPVAQVGTSIYVHNTVFPQAAVRQIPNSQNNSVSYDLVIPAGTWSLSLLHYANTNIGIYTLDLDGTALTSFSASTTTIDGYAASGTPTLSTITGLVIPSPIKRRLTLKMATKNASSSAYFGQVNSVLFTRTA